MKRKLAEKNNLTYIETTSQSNGYPANIQGAIIGFDTFADAEKFAKEHGLQVEIFTKKYGWRFWQRTGDTAYNEIELDVNQLGDNYAEFNIELEFIALKEKISEAKTFEEIQNLVENYNISALQSELADEDEVVITYEGRYFDTFKKSTMHFIFDTNHTAIGVI